LRALRVPGKFFSKRTVFAFLFAYGFCVIFTYQNQRSILYRYNDSLLPLAEAGASDMEAVTTRTRDGLDLTAWYKPPAAVDKPVILMFHGAWGTIDKFVFMARPYLDAGYGVLLAEYRGFGGNPGKPHEEGLYDDARSYIGWLIADRRINPRRIVLYGQSLGTGVAIQMATEYPDIAAVILESPFTSMAAAAQHRYFWAPAYWLTLDRYESIKKIAHVKAPVFIFHGAKDRIVPSSQPRALFQEIRGPKKIEELPAGTHLNLYTLGAADLALAFLGELPPLHAVNP